MQCLSIPGGSVSAQATRDDAQGVRRVSCRDRTIVSEVDGDMLNHHARQIALG